MDKRIRRNEICVIGLPRCDFVFSSTRTCFIAYGFMESALEMTILRNLLKEKGMEPIEAGGALAPAQNAFCAKICSKIITSQFCIVLLNNDLNDGQEVPNANVNMEYGLMLGFNKYIIPFQRASQSLPFNVAGLDTVKYTDQDFERKAASAIDQAIKASQQDTQQAVVLDQILETFILTRKALVTPLNTEGDKNLFNLGRPLGFNLLNDFSGFTYIFFGNFSALRSEVIVWRVRMLNEILQERRLTLNSRVGLGFVTKEQALLLDAILEKIQIWLVVTNDEDKDKVTQALQNGSKLKTQVFSIHDIQSEIMYQT